MFYGKGERKREKKNGFFLVDVVFSSISLFLEID